MLSSVDSEAPRHLQVTTPLHPSPNRSPTLLFELALPLFFTPTSLHSPRLSKFEYLSHGVESDTFSPPNQSLPLPPKPTTYEVWRKDWPQYLSAYNVAFSAERYATQQALTDHSKEAHDRIIYARVFGYLLIELFIRRAKLTDGPCNRLLMELQSEDWGDGDDKIFVFNIGQFYCDNLLRSFRTPTTSYLTSSPSPSFDSDMVEEMDEHSDDRTAKDKALARDGYRCLLTGFFDRASAREDRGLYDKCDQLCTLMVKLAACRILKEPMMQGRNRRVINKAPYATTTLSILQGFGLNKLVQDLAEDGADCPINLLSLDPISRDYFDVFDLWFEYTEEPNRYQVCLPLPRDESYFRRFRYIESDDHGRLFVTFADTSESPDPQLLGLHTVSARVAHLSGAAGAFDFEECDLEDDLEEECDLEDTSIPTVHGLPAHLRYQHLLTPLKVIPEVG